MPVNRLRIIAGPNGSGKTTLYFFLKNNIPTGTWVNADEILEQFKRKGFIEYSLLGFTPTEKSFILFCKKVAAQKFIQEFGLVNNISNINFGQFAVTYSSKSFSNELAAFLTDFFRFYLIQQQQSITTETVFSHESKLHFVKDVKKKKYKTYLYFIATSSPDINIKRVNSRVFKGGHSVPQEKLKSRYSKSILLLKKTIPVFDRVYIFDNSGKEIQLIASYNNGQLEKIYSDAIPNWLGFLF
jgi:predicted ABC-type ATPase